MTTRDFEFEIKSADDATGEFEGLASVYGNEDSQGDVVMPGAFDNTIRARGGKVVILSQHDPGESLGIGTLADAPKGLRIRGRLHLALSKAREEYERTKAGLITGLSVGYTTVRERMNRLGQRELLEIDLWEVSLVTFPSNPLARIESVKGDRRHFEAIWRSLATDDAVGSEAAIRALRAAIRDMRRTA